VRRARGFTLVELAVAGLVAAVVALMATMLFVPAVRMWQQAQRTLGEQSDYLEVRRALVGDVQQAVSGRVVRQRLLLRRTDGVWACYRFREGRLERAESATACRRDAFVPLTTLNGYDGRFEVSGAAVRLRFTRLPGEGALPEVYAVTRAAASLR
jgi:type II secretory pathway pseudopilin PulG